MGDRTSSGMLTRRELVRRGALAAGGALALGPLAACGGGSPAPPVRRDFGPLVKDPEGFLDLPAGFRYRILSDERSTLADGAPVPAKPDGMAAFAGADGSTVLVRNHELSDEGPEVPRRNPYDPRAPGGTTAVVVAPDRQVLDHYVLSSGTFDNCAGGRTPWGTWLTCEESHEDGHGLVFEVVPGDRDGRLARRPIRAMGAFSHEAVGVDPGTGIVYLTEDDYGPRALPSSPADEARSSGAFLYRYVPDDRRGRPGTLHEGGRLEVLALDEPVAARNADLLAGRQRLAVVWRAVRAEDPRGDALGTAGAVRFNRLEGAAFAGGALWFADTAGGEARLGQIFRYRPAANALELFYEGTDAARIESPDNLVVAPWGDLWFAEDKENGYGTSQTELGNRVMGVTPEGSLYPFAQVRGSELAGPTFAPDGQTFFLNAQQLGVTVAVWGPFGRESASRRAELALARPPADLAPNVSEHRLEAAQREGVTPLQAAAFERLAVRLG